MLHRTTNAEVSILETARTVLRPFTESDADLAFEWFGDPEVMRFIPSGADLDINASLVRIRRYVDHQKANGFSKWIIIESRTGKAIGDAGYFLMPDKKRVELGYRLSRNCWGRGIATEVASKWLEVAQPWFGFREVFAFAHPENTSSLRVIKKLGFTFHKDEHLHGRDAPVYKKILV